MKDIQKYVCKQTKYKAIRPQNEIPSMNIQETFDLLMEIEQLTGMKPAASLITADPSHRHITSHNEEVEASNGDLIDDDFETTNCVSADYQSYDRRALLLFLVQLYKTEYLQFSLEELRQVSDNTNIAYTKDDITFIENITKGQSDNWYWHKIRTGRVTASIFKQVCRTKIMKPSLSLIKQICWPEQTKFHCKEVDYGRQNEKKSV